MAKREPYLVLGTGLSDKEIAACIKKAEDQIERMMQTCRETKGQKVDGKWVKL